MPTPLPDQTFRFAAFELDTRSGELRKRGVKIKLQDQPVQILMLLLDRAGEVVSREEIRRKLWSENTFVDFDNAISSAVRKIREALSDSSDTPRFIETVARQGYRFICPLCEGDEAVSFSAPESTSIIGLVNGHPVAARHAGEAIQDIEINPQPGGCCDQPEVTEAKATRRRWWTISATLAFGTLGGWTLNRLRAPVVHGLPLRVEIDPPEGGQFSFGLGIGGIALSPDGRSVALVVTRNRRTALWLRPLDGTEGQLVPGTQGAAFPFWSPDSKSLAFFAAGKLHRIDLADGTLTTLCDAHREWGGAWTSDGQIIFSAFGFGLRQVAASGGAPSPFTTLDPSRSEGLHLWPQILPGDRFTLFVQSHSLEHTGVYAASLAKPNDRVHLLTTDAKALYASGSDGRDYLVWQRAGMLAAREFDVRGFKLTGKVRTLGDRVAVFGGGMMNATVSGDLLLCGNTGTTMQFTWFDRTGKQLGRLGEPGEYVYFRLSPDGRHVVAARTKPDGRDLWLLETGRGVANRLTASSGQKGYPIWSSDGQTILFASSAPYNLFARALAGGDDEVRVTQSSNYQVPNDSSRGGSFLLYTEIGPATGLDLWILPVTRDGKAIPNARPRPYLRTQFNEWNGRFSPEPEPLSVAYESDESGRYDVYVDSFPEARHKVLVSIGGGRYPQWGLNGHQLFYLSPDGKLMEVGVMRSSDSIEISSPRELFALRIIETGISPYEVAPDGQSFLVRATPENQAAQPLTLIVNWPMLLKIGIGAR
jgi:eukaryotic-like serine/threonine-protein kinase